MKFNPALLILLLSFFGAGCSQLSTKSNENYSFSKEQLEQMNREALNIASQRLEEMVIKTKGNPQSADYLATDLFLKANMSMLDGDFLTAATLFKHVAELAPNDSFIKKKLAINLIRLGELEETQIVLENLYANEGEEKVGMILAGVYTGLDKEDKARGLYSELLTRNPKNEDACIYLSKSYALNKEIQRAMRQLEKCAAKNPKNGIYDYYIGKLHIDQGKIPLALQSFKKSYARQPDLTQAVNALGILHEEREQFNEAIVLYEKHLKLHPNDISILNRAVQALFAKERYSEVIPYAERLSDLEPENLNLKVKLGILYTDSKQYAEAISVFKDLLAVAPQSDKILYYLGSIHQELKQFENSIEYFNQIPTSSGLYTDSSVQMANMLSTLAQKEFHQNQGEDKWQTSFLKLVDEKLKEHKELQVEFSIIKSGFFEGTSQFEKAMTTMAQVQNEKNFSIQHKYYLANLYEKAKKYAESTDIIMNIINQDPKNAQAWNFLGYSMLVRGEELDKAYEYIQNALRLSPDDGYIRDSLGWYYFKKGDHKRALMELEIAFKKIPDDIEVLKHLAIVHAEMRDFKKARHFLQTALKHAKYEIDRNEIMVAMEGLDGDRHPASGNID
jgi:tetratricopeptide (TPR) repeat protein